MIVLWLGYALGVSAALVALSLAAEYVLRLYGRPTRWLWATSLVGSLVLPLLAWLVAPVARAAAGPAGVTLGQPMVLAAGAAPVAPPPPAPWHAWLDAALTRSGPFLLDGWVLASLLLATLVLVSCLRLRRQRARWRDAEVDGVCLYVSGALGPAVVGLRRPRIVVPEWVLGESEARRRLILAHEAEHVAAGDGRLLAGAYGALVLAPWNALVWWQVRRLRLAAEVDCDARVVRRGADLRGYAGLLLEVGERFGAAAPAAAFAEPRSLLSRRLRVLTAVPPARRGWRAAAVALAGLTVAALACVAPRPDRPGEVSPTEPIEAPKVTAVAGPIPDAHVLEEPATTPLTVAPELINRDETRKALRDSYPPLLRAAGIGGTTQVWALVERDGSVALAKVKEPSGHVELDSAALKVTRAMRFKPGLNGAAPVPVWIALPIVFKTSPPGPHGDSVAAPNQRAGAPPSAASTPDERTLRQGPTFTPYTDPPSLSNREEVTRALVREYPSALRDAGVNGLVQVWLLIDHDGSVAQTSVKRTSGRAELDSAALRVARGMTFTPGKNGAETVPVWVALPIVFNSGKGTPPVPVMASGATTRDVPGLARDSRYGIPGLPEGYTPPEAVPGEAITGFARDYPADAPQVSEYAWIRVSIDAAGKVTSYALARTSGDATLDRAALQLVGRLHFTPAKDAAGNPAAVTVGFPVPRPRTRPVSMNPKREHRLSTA